MKNLILSALILFVFCLTSCKKDKDASPAFSAEIQAIVPQSIIDDLRKRGMPINEGITPPNVEGIYISSPHTLVSTYEGDSYTVGYEFADLTVKLSKQDEEALSVAIDTKQNTSSGTGIGGFIAGAGNKFTIFAELDVVDGTVTSKQIRVFSGEITANGIKDFYSALVIKEKNDPDDTMIEVGQGRIIKDGDGLAENISSFRTGGSSIKTADKIKTDSQR